MSQPLVDELLALNQRLLDSIADADWATYQKLCDPTLTAIEPEAMGQLVEGMQFHRFYFELGGIKGRHKTTMAAPKVRLLNDAAIIAYVRLIQRVSPEGTPVTIAFEETRIWQRQGAEWKHVHFHRSKLSPA
jgi:hypothetical protein